jgi:UDP-2,3-diacylglucosamine pyrophosphatase LpxH
MTYDYKSIFISDIHLGTRGCQAEALCEFLKNNTCENLFLVGDILDGWRLRKKWYFPQSHANVIRRILTAAKRGTNVYYILGNHDEALRSFLRYDLSFGDIKILNHYDYIGVDSKKYLITHGDAFDNLMTKDKKWIMHMGDNLYDFFIWFNRHFNGIRRLLGLKYWSLSKWLKDNAKHAVRFINRFEEYISAYCEAKGYDGVICGHIHKAEIKTIGNIVYMNDGDWVESATALLEHTDGTWEIYYHAENTYSDRQSSRSN